MKLSYFYFLRRARKNAKSQALAEFAAVLPVYLALMCGVFDYGWYIGNKTMLVMAVATAVQVGARSEDGMADTLKMVTEIIDKAPRPRLNMTSDKGAAVVTFIIRPGSSNFIRVNTGNPTNAVASLGLLFGSDYATRNKSRLVLSTNSDSWTLEERRVPNLDPKDLVQGRVYCHVEAWYNTEMITPLQAALQVTLPTEIYDSYLQFSLQNPDTL
ncbi:MAG: TadE family protein [Candidatus Methylacidiphilales bacterium]|nr:TadE family protein [Candidatus Methylacidiphilales bacterium]